MCHFKSGIVIFINDDVSVKTIKGIDEHIKIREHFNIKDDFCNGFRQEPVEFIPRGKSLFDFDDYELIWDDGEPDWLTPELEDRVYQQMVKAVKNEDFGNYDGYIDLSSCIGLTSIPKLKTSGSITLSGCTGLTSIPELKAGWYIDLKGCTGLTSISKLEADGYIDLSSCIGLTSIPKLKAGGSIDLRGCTGLKKSKINKNIRYKCIF